MLDEPRRPLGAGETALWRFDRGACLNFTTVARLVGPLTRAALVAGLRAAQARHPLLRARIAADEEGPRLEPTAWPIPLTVLEGPSGGWVAPLNEELAAPVDWARGPLARAVWLRHDEADGRLLLTLHHSAGDGLSGVFVLRDVVASAAASLRGVDPALPALGDPGPIEARLPRHVERLYALRGSTGLTNLGRLAVVTDHPPLSIETLRFAVATSGLGDAVTTATSLHGRLFRSFCHAAPTAGAASRAWPSPTSGRRSPRRRDAAPLSVTRPSRAARR